MENNLNIGFLDSIINGNYLLLSSDNYNSIEINGDYATYTMNNILITNNIIIGGDISLFIYEFNYGDFKTTRIINNI